MITFTEKGAEKVQEFLSSQSADVQTSGLRVGVRGGGCSGFQYALAFDTERDGDTVFEDHGLRILVDSPSLPYVQGRGRRLRRVHAGRRLQGRQPERHRGLRLRLLLPRGGGGRSLRRLTASRFSGAGALEAHAPLRLRRLRELLQGPAAARPARAAVRAGAGRHLRRRHADRRVRGDQPAARDAGARARRRRAARAVQRDPLVPRGGGRRSSRTTRWSARRSSRGSRSSRSG